MEAPRKGYKEKILKKLDVSFDLANSTIFELRRKPLPVGFSNMDSYIEYRARRFADFFRSYNLRPLELIPDEISEILVGVSFKLKADWSDSIMIPTDNYLMGLKVRKDNVRINTESFIKLDEENKKPRPDCEYKYKVSRCSIDNSGHLILYVSVENYDEVEAKYQSDTKREKDKAEKAKIAQLFKDRDFLDYRNGIAEKIQKRWDEFSKVKLEKISSNGVLEKRLLIRLNSFGSINKTESDWFLNKDGQKQYGIPTVDMVKEDPENVYQIFSKYDLSIPAVPTDILISTYVRKSTFWTLERTDREISSGFLPTYHKEESGRSDSSSGRFTVNEQMIDPKKVYDGFDAQVFYETNKELIDRQNVELQKDNDVFSQTNVNFADFSDYLKETEPEVFQKIYSLPKDFSDQVFVDYVKELPNAVAYDIFSKNTTPLGLNLKRELDSQNNTIEQTIKLIRKKIEEKTTDIKDPNTDNVRDWLKDNGHVESRVYLDSIQGVEFVLYPVVLRLYKPDGTMSCKLTYFCNEKMAGLLNTFFDSQNR